MTRSVKRVVLVLLAAAVLAFAAWMLWPRSLGGAFAFDQPFTLTVTELEMQEDGSWTVNDLLEELIQQSVSLVGKPVALMNKEDKVRAIRFLNQNGAFLVTKSGDKIAKYFGISKYTLYSYIDTKQQEGK